MPPSKHVSGAGALPGILTGPEAELQIGRFLGRCERARLAVAYWGAGAVKRLKLKEAAQRSADIQIVCDLLSGGCNPAEVEQLRKALGPEKIRTRDGLHAKAWITDVGCVLGSSNASANGLGQEADETKGLVEANLAYPKPSPEDVANWERWFEEQAWTGSKVIDDAMIEEARLRWSRRRAERDRPGSLTDRRNALVPRLLSEPDYFKDKQFTVVIYVSGDPGPESNAALAAAQDELHDTTGTIIGCYADREFEPGTVVLDIHWDLENGKAKEPSLWQILSDDPKRPKKGGGSITLCREIPDFEGLELGCDKELLLELATCIMQPRRAKDLTMSGDKFGRAAAKAQARGC